MVIDALRAYVVDPRSYRIMGGTADVFLGGDVVISFTQRLLISSSPRGKAQWQRCWRTFN